MKKFLNEILKPIAIFSLYITIVALLSNIIEVYYNSNISIISAIILILTYPIYLHLINYNGLK
jgi:ABC-type nitrate/sulfonate/bicarbonate transport system permease component